MSLDQLLTELERQGEENDAATTDRPHKLLNITRDTGELLALLIKANKARNVLEVGTSNGYSTLWLANALPDEGKVVTVEKLPHKIEMARANFEASGLAAKIEQFVGDAADYLGTLNRRFDLVFLDAERTDYMSFADAAIEAVVPGGLLVCDNALSHADEIAPFIAYVEQTGEFTTATLTVGKGEYVACKHQRAHSD